LARKFSERRVTEVSLESSVKDENEATGDLSILPVVPKGYEASDKEIGDIAVRTVRRLF
jgi:hypothetical protein